MKQPGTTKKHSGSAKHGGAGKHNPPSHHGGVAGGGGKGKGTAQKHTPAKQHQSQKPQHPQHTQHHQPSHHNPKGPKQPQAKTRKLALGYEVACCSAEALAASLRLAGHPVSGSDVYALYRACHRGDDDGETILATLKAASTFGLAGIRLAGFRAVPVSSPFALIGGELPGSHALYVERGRAWSWGAPLDLSRFPDWEPEEAWRIWWAA